jgi:hypothetical protein
MTLFGQTEESSRSLKINLSDKKDKDGFYPKHIGMEASGVSSGAYAVQSALSRLRPLAFAAAFKIQDMIAEWILHANGSTAWIFKQKIADYRSMRRTLAWSEPSAFATRAIVSSSAFWELYGALCVAAPNIASSYCLICRCYPDSGIADDDPMSIDRPRHVAFPACSTRGAVGGSGPG